MATTMALTSNLRKLVRTLHIIVSVGWLGAVASFFALSIVGLTSPDAETVRSVYIATGVIGWYLILPLSFVPLLITGPLLSLGTPWGLLRHYWIIAKLLINLISTLVLLGHMKMISSLWRAAVAGTLSHAHYGMQLQMVIASGAALVALLIATVLAVYKPRGMTAYGWRKQYEARPMPQTNDMA